MKLLKAYTIFTSRKYRIIMSLLLAAVVVLNLVLGFGDPDMCLFFQIYIVSFVGLIPLYGDLEVFAGLHAKDSGQIASIQSSVKGFPVMAKGILADRIAMFLFVFLVDLSVAISHIKTVGGLNIWNLITGTAVVYCLLTIAININRYFSTRWTVLVVCALEAGIVGWAAVWLWIFYPMGNLLSCIVGILLAILVSYLTVIHALHHLKRSYYDE